jgi:DNA-damage-inducible protein D
MANIEERNTLSFEDFKNQNGITYWWASDLMLMLGYSDMKSFEKVLNRATKTMVSLNIPHYDNIIAVKHSINGKECQDFKLTRFACYLTAMNGDPKKHEVAVAQIYFAEQTRKFEVYAQSHNEIDRLLIRDELTDGNKSLASAAKAAKVTNYVNHHLSVLLITEDVPSGVVFKKNSVYTFLRNQAALTFESTAFG